jgi:DNA primase
MVPCDKGLRHDFLPGSKGLFHPEATGSDGVVLVEGVFDALACLAGQLPASALCGLTTRESWWKTLAARTLILALDADQAAQQRRETLATAAVRAGKRVLIVRSEYLLPHKDLNEYWVQTQTMPAALRRAVKKAAVPRRS